MEKSLFIARYKLNERYKELKNWDDEIQSYVEQHAEYLKVLGREGSLVFAGRTLLEVKDDNLFGIALFKYNSEEKLNKILKEDLAIQHGVQSVEVFPFSMGIQFFKNLNTNNQ